jgi:hypothetical protein
MPSRTFPLDKCARIKPRKPTNYASYSALSKRSISYARAIGGPTFVSETILFSSHLFINILLKGVREHPIHAYAHARTHARTHKHIREKFAPSCADLEKLCIYRQLVPTIMNR